MTVGPVGTGGWHWRVVFEWKTAGDYRVIASVKRDPYVNGGNLFWATVAGRRTEDLGRLPVRRRTALIAVVVTSPHPRNART